MKPGYRFFLVWFFCLLGGLLDLDAQESSPPLSSAATNAVPSAATVSPAATVPTLAEGLLLRLLTEKLQADCVKDRGELELHLARPWHPIPITDEALSLKILELPSAGVTSQFIVKFEVLAPTHSLGVWQAVLQAKIWREINVAKVPLLRGRILDPADLALERRDVISFRSDLAEIGTGEIRQELTENLPVGAPLTARSLKVRPVVRRGQTAEALLADGTMQITMKVEVLEDGIPGQAVRVRNLQSRREFRGIVQNENRILVSL